MIYPFDKMIRSSHYGYMLFEAPDLDDRDHCVIESIEKHREKLRHYIHEPRRWNGQLRRTLRARAMRGSNSIEGIDVSLDDALALLEGEEPLDADQRTVLEVTGYRNAMTYVQQLADDKDFHFDTSLLRALHFMMLGHDLVKKPGAYRTGDIYVKDEDLDEIVYTGPDAGLVSSLMDALLMQLEHLDDNIEECPIFVSAAMAHLNLVMIHPFKDGNGRMARCLQTMILARNQILAPEFSSIDEWLGRNTSDYYDVLATTGRAAWHPENDATSWVRFNLRAHYMQAQTVLQRVYESQELWARLTEVAEEQGLPERSVAGLWPAALRLRLRRSTYESDAEVEQGTAARDLRQMVAAGLLEARGETRGRYYVGSDRLVAEYRSLRSGRARPVDPYAIDVSDLGPKPRRRVITVGR